MVQEKAGEMVTLMANATKKVKEMAPDLDIDGELQFDAAVAHQKLQK